MEEPRLVVVGEKIDVVAEHLQGRPVPHPFHYAGKIGPPHQPLRPKGVVDAAEGGKCIRVRKGQLGLVRLPA